MRPATASREPLSIHLRDRFSTTVKGLLHINLITCPATAVREPLCTCLRYRFSTTVNSIFLHIYLIENASRELLCSHFRLRLHSTHIYFTIRSTTAFRESLSTRLQYNPSTTVKGVFLHIVSSYTAPSRSPVCGFCFRATLWVGSVSKSCG